MTQTCSADYEKAFILPLGVVANQLQRIETQLRLLNMEALDFARQRENSAVRGLIEARLEQISQALDSIARVVSDIESDIRPNSTDGTRASIEDETLPLRTYVPSGDGRTARDAGASDYPTRKSRDDRDD